jgi:putative DNA primase/helicase
VLNSVHALTHLEAYVPDEKWDANSDVLIMENGAVEVETGRLINHSPDHYATTRVPYAFDPAAKAPNWRRLLAGIEPEVVEFLQEFAGYCLTTDTSLERAAWLVGRPGGGKSSFLEGLRAMLGEARAGVLGLAQIERSQFSLGGLVGKTLVLAAEQPARYISSHYILNAIISGEAVTIERKHKDPYEYIPSAKIAWAMNEMPRIPNSAEGLFRRVALIKFPEIPEKDRDPDLKEGIKTEGAGVFNWALAGLQRLRARGNFELPAKIIEDTNELREMNDIEATFVRECCVQGKELSVKASELHKAYRRWCEETGHTPKSSTTIPQEWERLGFAKEKRASANYYRGLAVGERPPMRY